jgi:hypothetical protein
MTEQYQQNRCSNTDCLFKYAKPITADIHPLVEPHLNGAVRQRTIEARLKVEVQAFERHREWSRREAEAYHTIFRYLSPHISIHVTGLETSRDLWNELEERYLPSFAKRPAGVAARDPKGI